MYIAPVEILNSILQLKEVKKGNQVSVRNLSTSTFIRWPMQKELLSIG